MRRKLLTGAISAALLSVASGSHAIEIWEGTVDWDGTGSIAESVVFSGFQLESGLAAAKLTQDADGPGNADTVLEVGDTFRNYFAFRVAALTDKDKTNVYTTLNGDNTDVYDLTMIGYFDEVLTSVDYDSTKEKTDIEFDVAGGKFAFQLQDNGVADRNPGSIWTDFGDGTTVLQGDILQTAFAGGGQIWDDPNGTTKVNDGSIFIAGRVPNPGGAPGDAEFNPNLPGGFRTSTFGFELDLAFLGLSGGAIPANAGTGIEANHLWTSDIQAVLTDGDLIATADGNILLETPLPAAVWLFGTAIAGLFGFQRRKQLFGSNASAA